MEALEIVVADKKTVHSEKHIERLYELTFPYVARFVRDMGGSFEDARDIFHDALVIFYEETSRNHLKIHTSEEAYILGISKHLWIRKYHRTRFDVPLSDMEKGISIPDDFYPGINNKRLLRLLEIAGRKCMDLLRAFYYQKVSLKQLANSLGYTNEHSASAQKYKCLEKIRNTIKEKSLLYEDFIE